MTFAGGRNTINDILVRGESGRAFSRGEVRRKTNGFGGVFVESINTVTIVRECLFGFVKPGAFCVDATAGNGHDTELLCRLVGEGGRVLAFDIQESAIASSRGRLEAGGFSDRAELVLDSHSHMDRYAEAGSADVVVFNFGFLPGGDKSIFTRADTSVEAIEKALVILKTGGLMCLSLYYGGPNGYEERDAILAYVRSLDPRAFTVIRLEFSNRGGDPPFPIFIRKGAY